MNGSKDYTTVVYQEMLAAGECCYVAYHPEILGVLGQGDSHEEAVAVLGEMTDSVIDYLKANNLPIPEPLIF